MPVHFHHPEAAAGVPRVTFASVLSRGGQHAYSELEMEALDDDPSHHHHPVPHHEPRLRHEDRVPSAPELAALAAKVQRPHPNAPKSWRRVDAAGEVTPLQV